MDWNKGPLNAEGAFFIVNISNEFQGLRDMRKGQHMPAVNLVQRDMRVFCHQCLAMNSCVQHLVLSAEKNADRDLKAPHIP